MAHGSKVLLAYYFDASEKCPVQSGDCALSRAKLFYFLFTPGAAFLLQRQSFCYTKPSKLRNLNHGKPEELSLEKQFRWDNRV